MFIIFKISLSLNFYLLFLEKVRALEQVIDQAQREQKELFIVIFQRFATVLSEYLKEHPAEGIWYRTILGYFKAIGRRVFPPLSAASLLSVLLIFPAKPGLTTC